jgi:CTP:molybdopterin cytidylyltransferase MocA
MVTAVVMVGPPPLATDETPVQHSLTEPAVWVQAARRAATRDLLAQLARQPLVEDIVVVSPLAADLAGEANFTHLASPPDPVHVGRTLAEVVERYKIRRLLYFGGGSAPLLDDETLGRVIERLATSESGLFTNNLFASDWAGIVPAAAVVQWQKRLPKDNMLGWVLSTEAGLVAESLPPSAASRLDVDTPGDLLTLTLHPATRPRLRETLEALALDTSALQSALAVLARPASHVFIAGRLAPEAWSALNRVTKCWLRVVSEERGMVSSGRLARGEAYSILGDYAERMGLPTFFDMLAKEADAALIDSRVLMAHRGHWPPDAERFASDTGLVDQIEDDWLREFTVLASDSPIPIILGGHGLLSGDLYALCDLLR